MTTGIFINWRSCGKVVSACVGWFENSGLTKHLGQAQFQFALMGLHRKRVSSRWFPAIFTIVSTILIEALSLVTLTSFVAETAKGCAMLGVQPGICWSWGSRCTLLSSTSSIVLTTAAALKSVWCVCVQPLALFLLLGLSSSFRLLRRHPVRMLLCKFFSFI